MNIKITPYNKEIEVWVDYDYQPAESQTWDYPGCSAECYPTSVKHGHIEIIDYLSEEMIIEIGEKILEAHEDARADAMISRFEDRINDLRD